MFKNPVKLALVTHGYGITGGVTTVVDWLRTELNTTGMFDVDILDLATSRADRQSRRIRNPRSWTRRSLQAHRVGDGFYAWGANAVELEFMRYRPRRELTRFLNRYDLVQIVCGTPAWAATASRCGRPVVVQAATRAVWEREVTQAQMPHAARAWRALMTGMTSIAERKAIRASQALLVENGQMAAFAKSLGQKRVHIAPPGVDAEVFRPRIGELTPPGYLLSVCRLGDPRKALDRSVRAYAKLLVQKPDAPPLILAGIGSLAPSVAVLIKELGLEKRILEHRDVAQEDLPGLYQGASVFIQTSREEGLGLSVLEAMSSGLPVVATRTAGSEETVSDGLTGWLIDQSDEESLPGRLAAKMVTALGETGRAAGKAGRERVLERFSSDSTIRHFINVYDDLLRDRSRD